MFWRSVVGKLWFTFLLLVSVVLAILSFLLLQFFQNFNIVEAEKDLMQTATKITVLIEQYDDRDFIIETADRVKDLSSRIVILFDDGDFWISDSTDDKLPAISRSWIASENDLRQVMEQEAQVKKQKTIPDSNDEVMIVGKPVEGKGGAVYVYQSLRAVKETTEQTTQIILISAGIAIVLTTVFAFFLSTRITSPLIKMREGAFELARGEFNTKVPILTHDEIGELAMAFNRMGRQLKFHINALRQEKEQLYSILSSMADGVITMNRKSEIIVTNPPAKKFLEDWYYENNVVQPDTLESPTELKKLLQEVIESEKEISREIFIQGRSWVIIMSPLYDQTYIRGVVAVIRDMTEERKLDQLREDFIANVSHELRTPISMLQGYSEAIVDDIAESKQEKNDLAKIIHEESLRMGRLVNELLDLARMKAGHISLNRENVKLELFLKRIVRKFKGLCESKEIQLISELNVNTASISIDPDRIEQVLTNLIDNAINHTKDNGSVIVSVNEQSNYLEFSIKDNGSGISQKDLAFVFERFYKADKSRKRKNGKTGTGLGLAIAKNIVEAHNGTISVQSKVNEGTTFTFRLPKIIEKAE
ncbi:ATP-binding protein [Aquibacillus salsiterrae]|uniref:histidine kinase n=1 Tax=Aquibacillus salsiterrae TaxID=2950439 RepID=A0A9X3WDG1_9BACI|nr:ATP-binding protein [Aquibacillus salsiterrae]MDC3415414.1 cell wall metabolism sensor histidine kinase WalK [Aquibacillus salsiterrae]